MVKITDEAKQAKLTEKEAAKKAKAEARAKAKAEKKAKQLELKKAKAEKKAARLAAKKEKAKALKAKKAEKAKAKKAKEKAAKAKAKERAKKIALKAKIKAKKEKERAKKLKLKEKAKALKAKKAEKAKKAKPVDVFKNAIVVAESDKGSLKIAAKSVTTAVKAIANEMSALSKEDIVKKAKSIRQMGYDVETTDDGQVIVKFECSSSKQIKAKAAKKADVKTPATEENTVVEVAPKKRGRKPKAKVEETTPDDVDSQAVNVLVEETVEPVSVEAVPAGDLLNDNGEVANLPPEDDEFIPDDEDEDMNSDAIPDSRDETDEGLIENRRDFFGQFGDDGEVNENY